jgi:hypothetical protein
MLYHISKFADIVESLQKEKESFKDVTGVSYM